MSEYVVTYPEWGNFSLALKLALRFLGVESITYGKANNKHLETGVKYSPESICFCFKPIFGGLVESIEKGANTVFWFDSHGKCRARYYSWLQRTLLEKLNHKVDFEIFDGRNILTLLKKISRKNYFEILRALIFGYQVLRTIENLEESVYWYRPREIVRGAADKVFQKLLKQIDSCHNLTELNKVRANIKAELGRIGVNENNPPKILIFGEIYLIHDSFANRDLLKILGQLGFEVKVTHKASSLVKHVLFGKYYHHRMVSLTKSYLNSDVGGHARENLMELLQNLKEGFVGVVHVGPFGCMPEVTVNPILQQIAKSNNLPYLFLSFDVQTSDTGLITRLEAFSDLVQRRMK